MSRQGLNRAQRRAQAKGKVPRDATEGLKFDPSDKIRAAAKHQVDNKSAKNVRGMGHR